MWSVVLAAGMCISGPPELPPVDDGAPPAEAEPELEDDPSWDQPEEELEDDPDWDAPDESAPAPVAPAPPVAPRPAPQKPTARQVAPAPTVKPPPPPRPASEATPQPAPERGNGSSGEQPEKRPQDEEEEDKDEQKEKQKLGGFRFLRFGVQPKIGFTSGTSQADGLFDRQKSIDDSIMSGEVMMTGAGDLGKTRFGGGMFGFDADLEFFAINLWLDFQKFFEPGGMWSLLIGYDHEFSLGYWGRLDLGLGVGMQKVFLGSALESLYVDPDDPTRTNIGTTGMEGRLYTGMYIKLVGPLMTGPAAMLGYHNLWSADAEEVVRERGLHFSVYWALRLDFATRPIED